MINYLITLNDRQKEAALHKDGPLLIVAGAGAGKTKTITHRIAHLMANGVESRRILAVTFTNKAAGEMRERVRSLLAEGGGERGDAPLILTFHALGVRLLREFHVAAGLPRAFVIWDRDDSVRAVKRALEQLDIDQPPRAILSAISRYKGDGRSRDSFSGAIRSSREQHIAAVWEKYEQVLKDEDALDFDDLLARTLLLLQNNTKVLDLLQSRWTYITIDEYQDTNHAQYEIARLLAGEKRNLCVVGDTDQNIYSWRGANLGHLLEFESDFPGTKVVLLEQNYRSTRTILSAANAVIEKNRRRKPKNLYTNRGTGEPIALYEARNEVDEAWYIAAMAGQLLESGTGPDEIAILYRENFQSRVLEEALLHAGVPYRVLGTRFFERKEVKDVLSYLRAAQNPKARADMARTVATPARGIGKVTLEKLLRNEDAKLAPAARAKVDAFRQTLEKIRYGITILPASEAVLLAIEASGLLDLYKGTEEGKERLENMMELVNFAVKYDSDTPPSGIERLLEEAALQSDQDQLEDKEEAVSLMTVHASKGLEFDAVFISGLEQGLFPSMRAGGESERDEEEERRLFYVALTRAKERLFLTYAKERMKYGSREYAIGSEFIDDIDARLIERAERKRGLLDDDEYIIR